MTTEPAYRYDKVSRFDFRRAIEVGLVLWSFRFDKADDCWTISLHFEGVPIVILQLDNFIKWSEWVLHDGLRIEFTDHREIPGRQVKYTVNSKSVDNEDFIISTILQEHD